MLVGDDPATTVIQGQIVLFPILLAHSAPVAIHMTDQIHPHFLLRQLVIRSTRYHELTDIKPLSNNSKCHCFILLTFCQTDCI